MQNTTSVSIEVRTKGARLMKAGGYITGIVAMFSCDLAERIGNWFISRLQAEYRAVGSTTWHKVPGPVATLKLSRQE